MGRNGIYILVLLMLSLVVTAILIIMLAKNSNNQEFKERTLILIDDANDGTTNKVQYTICQWKEKKIEIEECPLENGVKKECSYCYPGFGDCNFTDEEYINLLDALQIQPGDTTTINMEDLETEILDTFGYLFEEGDGDGDGNGDGNGDGTWSGSGSGSWSGEGLKTTVVLG